MRADGKRIKNADPMYTVGAYIMSKRVDSMNMITVDIPLDPIKKYIAKRREYKISHLALVISAYLRTAAEYPQLNRFIMHNRTYARKGIVVSFVVHRSLRVEDGGTTIKIIVDGSDEKEAVEALIELISSDFAE